MNGRRRLPMEKALLGFLMAGPMHGYELHRCVEEELGRIWSMGISNVYGALKRLEGSGQVSATIAPQDNRPDRKIYRVTPAGRESFLDWMRRPVPAMRDMRVEFLAKLYFFHALGIEGSEELIAAQDAVCRERVERLEGSLARCGPQDFDRLIFDFRRRQIEAILGWLTSCREEWEKWTHAPAAARP
jgi:PadR family transcriptional regulator AphA